MDILDLYANIRRVVWEVDHQCEMIAGEIAAGGTTADRLLSGIWTNAFEAWTARLRVLRDLADPAVDVTKADYGHSDERLKQWGLDRARMQEDMRERDAAKLTGFWRADKKDARATPNVALDELLAAMAATRNWVAANYKTLTGGGSGFVVGDDGSKSWRPLEKTDLAALETLLATVRAKAAALLP